MATQVELSEISLEEASRHLSHLIYAASLFVERLEDAGRYQGNGHHFAQNLAQEAVDRLKRNWIEPKIIVTDQTTKTKQKA